MTKSLFCFLTTLQIFNDATVFFSSDQIASISSVVPTMDKIDKILTRNTLTTATPSVEDLCAGDGSVDDDENPLATLADDDIHPSVKMALLLAKKTMNRYYGKTDESNVYRISMSTLSSPPFFAVLL